MWNRTILLNFYGITQVLTAMCLILGYFCCAQNLSTTSPIDPAQTNCPAGSAAIQVGDGFLKILCGCISPSEANGTVFPTPGNLTCHLASNHTTVMFYYLGTTLQHQIVPNGPNTFLSSPVSDPSASTPILVHSVKLNQTGAVYEFEDAYSRMNGKIFVP